MKTKAFLGIAIYVISYLTSCKSSQDDADAYGTFEADEVMVSSEVNGKILEFTAEEGHDIKQGEIIGKIDTVQLYLKKEQLLAQRSAISSKNSNVGAQADVLKAQLKTAKSEKIRITNLLKDDAATPKQLDDINAQINVLEKQILSVETQNSGVYSEVKAIDAQIDQINDQLKKCNIENPVNGSVLNTYATKGEMALSGKPLYKIANLKHFYLTVYMDALQIQKLSVGQNMDVFIDKDENTNTKLEGAVSWISPTAEFTPKFVQTKEERVNLVYAVKIKVENNGELRIGMPGEVKLREKIK